MQAYNIIRSIGTVKFTRTQLDGRELYVITDCNSQCTLFILAICYILVINSRRSTCSSTKLVYKYQRQIACAQFKDKCTSQQSDAILCNIVTTCAVGYLPL